MVGRLAAGRYAGDLDVGLFRAGSVEQMVVKMGNSQQKKFINNKIVAGSQKFSSY